MGQLGGNESNRPLDGKTAAHHRKQVDHYEAGLMPSRRQTQATIRLTLKRVSASRLQFAETHCLDCDVSLGWDQPDPDEPDRGWGSARNAGRGS